VKIIVPVEHLGPVGGEQRAMLELAEALSRRGHDFVVAYRVVDSFYSRWAKIAKLVSVPATLSRWRPFRTLFGPLWGAWKLRGVRADLIFCGSLALSMFALLVARLKRIPLVLWIQEPPVVGFRRIIYRFTIRRAGAIAYVSGYLRAAHQVSEFSTDSGRVIHVGLDLDLYRPPSEVEARQARSELRCDDKLVVLYLGRIDPTKGIETLFEAVSFLKDLDVEVIVAGAPSTWRRDGPSYALKLIDQAPPQVRFLKRVDDPRQLLWASDIVVVPSIWNEPLPRVQVEAMACGSLVVASRVGGIPEAFPGQLASLLFEPGDAEGLARAVRRVLAHSGDSPKWTALGRTNVCAHFNMVDSVDSFEDVFALCLSNDAT
jgi:glycosyltransferase involved in cell wall biosynthesis